jgi:hypothetical protein
MNSAGVGMREGNNKRNQVIALKLMYIKLNGFQCNRYILIIQTLRPLQSSQSLHLLLKSVQTVSVNPKFFVMTEYGTKKCKQVGEWKCSQETLHITVKSC